MANPRCCMCLNRIVDRDSDDSDGDNDNDNDDDVDSEASAMMIIHPRVDGAHDDSSSSSSSGSNSDSDAADGGITRTLMEGSLDMPNSIRVARRRLTAIFDRTYTTFWHNTEGHNCVLQVLQKFPAMAAATFEDPYEELKFPLAHLLAAHAPLYVIQAIYELYPSAIARTQGLDGDLPLHEACKYGASTEVIRFLAMEHPAALTTLNVYQMLPIHEAVRCSFHRTQPATLRLLVELYPDCIMTVNGDDDDDTNKSLLESAFWFGYDPEVVELMTEHEHWPQGHDVFNCHLPVSVPLDRPRAELLSRVLPHLKCLRCYPREWTLDGFVHLMDSLAQVRSLDELELLAFPGQLIVESQEAQRAFSNFMEQTNLTLLIIVFPMLENFCDVPLRIMSEALQNNRGLIERLELRQMKLSNSRTLSNLLLTAKSPKELVLEQLSVQEGGTKRLTSPPEHRYGAIGSLAFVDCPMLPAEMEGILHNVAWMPALRRLALKFISSAPGWTPLSPLSLTDPLISILNQNHLQLLSVAPIFRFDFDSICEALRTNSSLQTIYSEVFSSSRAVINLKLLVDVLEKDNTTLHHCGLVSTGRHDKEREKAIELIRLNRFGRGRLRAGDSTIDEFLKDLLSVQEEANLKLPIDKLNVKYGLLREKPSLWSSVNLSQSD